MPGLLVIESLVNKQQLILALTFSTKVLMNAWRNVRDYLVVTVCILLLLGIFCEGRHIWW